AGNGAGPGGPGPRPRRPARLPAGLRPAAVLRGRRPGRHGGLRRRRAGAQPPARPRRRGPHRPRAASARGCPARGPGGGARAAEWLGAIRKKEQDSEAKLLVERQSSDVPISHYRMAHEIAAVVDAGTTVGGDGGGGGGGASEGGA